MIHLRMEKQGFSLVELIVGLMLSAILGTVLFSAFFQSNRTLRFVEESAELDTGISVILRQLERDLAGAIEPAYTKEEKDQTETGKENEKEKKEKKPSFVAKTKNNQLDILSFITTNPRSRYGSPLPTTTPKPSLVRVMYKLRAHKEKKELFMLLRQESTNLDMDSFAKKNEKRPRELIVSDAVQQCSVEFMYRELPEDDEKKEEKKEATEKKEPVTKKESAIKTVQSWGDQKAEEKIPLLPLMVKLTLTVWDARFQVKRSIVYFMPVYTTYVEPVRKKQKQGSPTSEAQQKSPQAGAQQQGQPAMKISSVPGTQPTPRVTMPMPLAKPKRRTLSELMGGR